METFCREYAGEMVGVHMAGDVIESTGRHPYWVVRGDELDSRPVTEELGDDNQPQNHPGRWVEARHLRVGDLLWTSSAGEVPIDDLLTCEATAVVYNFHVAECHSYTVGESQVLVHNQSPKPDEFECDPDGNSIRIREKCGDSYLNATYDPSNNELYINDMEAVPQQEGKGLLMIQLAIDCASGPVACVRAELQKKNLEIYQNTGTVDKTALCGQLRRLGYSPCEVEEGTEPPIVTVCK